MSGRAIGAIGVAGVLISIAATLIEPLWDFPSTAASSAEVARFVAANRDGVIAAVTIYTLGMALYLAFCAGTWSLLSRRDDVSDVLATIFGACSVAQVAVVFAGFAPTLVIAYRAPEVAGARELRDLSFGILGLSGAPTAVALGAFAAIALRGRLIHGASAWLAVLAAVAHLAIVFTFAFESGFLSLEGFGIVAIPATMFAWMLATGIALLRGRLFRAGSPAP
jgi:hypothetical protein